MPLIFKNILDNAREIEIILNNDNPGQNSRFLPPFDGLPLTLQFTITLDTLKN
jgi:hypothetical protein